MKKIIIYLIILLNYTTLSAQEVHIETNIGKSFSGFGDIFGNIGDVGVRINYKKNYFMKINFGIGHSSKSAFSEQEYKNTTNLLVLDKWTENYPYSYIEGTFRPKNIEQFPSSNYQNLTFCGAYIGKRFSISKRFTLLTSIGLRVMKVENSYVTLKVPSKVINIYGEIDGLLPISHLLSFIEFPLLIDIGLIYNIKRNFGLGLFFHNSGGIGGSIQLASMGIRLDYKI